MRIFAKQQRFSPRTGKPEGTAYVCVEERCDFTGRTFCVSGDPDNQPYYWVTFDYGTEDPCFGATGEEFRFGRDHNINMHDFLSAPYAVADNESVKVIEYAHSRKMDFATACRDMRLASAQKLIAEGTILPCQLEGYEGDAELPDASKYDEDGDSDEDEDSSGWEH